MFLSKLRQKKEETNDAEFGSLMRRRKILQALVGACTFSVGNHVSAQTGRLPPYCSIDPTVDLERYRARGSTGNKRLDRVLIIELRSIMQLMLVNPGFKIIDDHESPNAFAMPRTIVNGTQGTVLFGVNLITTELRSQFGGIAVSGIAAHECAHIYQFFSRYGSVLTSNKRTAKSMELHADFLAGFYLGRDKVKKTEIEAFARSLYEKGDHNFNHPAHHGTPEERVEAMSRGFSLSERSTDIENAAEVGMRVALG